MRNVDGFVLIARRNSHILFFGRATKPDCAYEALSTNGLQPFPSLEDARVAKSSLEQKRGYGVVDIRQLHMSIAENDEDAAALNQNHTLVVVQLDATDPTHLLMYGQPVQGCTKLFDCVNALGENNLLPFFTHAGAMDAAFQVARQSQCETRIASLILR